MSFILSSITTARITLSQCSLFDIYQRITSTEFDNSYLLLPEPLQQLFIIPHTPPPYPFDALTRSNMKHLAREGFAELNVGLRDWFCVSNSEVKSENKRKRKRDITDDCILLRTGVVQFKKWKMADGRKAIDLKDQ